MHVRQVGWGKSRGWLGVWVVCVLCGCDRPVDGSPPHATETGPGAAQSLSNDIKSRSREPSLELSRPSGTEVNDVASALPALSAIATAPSDEDAAGDGRSMRWAILGTPTVRDSGFSDLLLAQLSTLGGIELVEREALKDIAAEYSVAEFGTAGAVRHRLQLGALLGADRLLLLSHAVVEDNRRDEDAPVFRMVIADCHTGARIIQEDHPAETDPQALVDAVIAAVGQTQARFPDGVVRIVGVSPFLSRNLHHSYDHRQAGYAYLLQHALALHPGTAVLEVEEARAVAQELSLGAPPPPNGAGSLRRRTVPALVDGEFTVAEEPTRGTQTVDLSVRVRRANDLDEIHKTALSPAEVASFLAAALPRRILASDELQTPLLSHVEQRDWLVARAEQFRRVGAWEYSLGLLEAALLIAHDDVALRLETIHQYELQMIEPLAVPADPRQSITEEKIREDCRERIGAYTARLAHLEYLILNRKLTAEEILVGLGSERITTFSTTYLARCIPVQAIERAYEPSRASEVEALYRRVACEAFREAEDAEAGFMQLTFPRIRSLPCADHEVIQRKWAEYLFQYHVRKAGDDLLAQETLDALYPIITEAYPASSRISEPVVRTVSRLSYIERLEVDARVTDEPSAWHDAYQAGPLAVFCNRLAEYERPAVQVYGRFGLLQRRWLLWQQRWQMESIEFVPKAAELGVPSGAEARYAHAERSELPEELRMLAEEARQLVGFYKSLDLPRSRAETTIRGLAGDIEHRLSSLSPLVGPIRRGRRRTHYTPGEEDRLARFEFAGRVDMVVKTLEGESAPVVDSRWETLQARWGSAYRWTNNRNCYPVVGWRKCTDSLDVLWNEWAVLLMREKGVAEEIFSEAGPRILNVQWDGRHLWVLTQFDGLRVVSLTGELIRRIGSVEGLPPFDQGVVLHPIRQGVICMAGSFGDQHRGWVAMIDTGSDQPVRVIHEATTVRSHEPRASKAAPAELAFTPTYTLELASGDTQQRHLLLGRRSDDRVESPLTVDLQTLEVAAYPRSLAVWQPRSSNHALEFLLHSGHGRILLPTGSGIVELSGPTLLNPDSLSRRPLCENGAGSQTLLPLGQWIYVPDDRMYWYRIHRNTFEQQPMLIQPSGRRFDIRPYTVFRISAHYGILLSNAFDGVHYLPYEQVLIHEPH